jgi:2-polyprenyl-6-methoxyphenol hydroxylase-like FAD-dependent oxidoreductase
VGQVKIAIVGGSLTGPLTALLLKQAGFDDVHVYEAVPQSMSRAGGVIGLDYASLDVLDELGISQSEYITYTSERIVSRCVQENTVMNESLTSYAGRNTSWTALHHALWRRLPERTRMPGAFRVTDIADGRLYFYGGMGGVEKFDLIIGADGRKSTVRSIFDPGRELHYAGYVAHRGWWGRELEGLLDFTRFEALGTQFNVFPDKGGIDWTFYMEETEEEFKLHYGASPEKRTFVMTNQISADAFRRVDTRAYAVLPPTEATIVQMTSERMVAPIMDIDPPTQAVFRDGDARVVLIGDALAPVRPHTARGMNNGVAQAEMLVKSLRQYKRWDADLDSVLSGWEQRVLPIVRNDIQQGPILAAKLGLGPRDLVDANMI